MEKDPDTSPLMGHYVRKKTNLFVIDGQTLACIVTIKNVDHEVKIP